MHAHWLAICQQYDKLEAKNFFHVYPQDDGRKVVLKQDGKYLDRRYDRGYDYEFCITSWWFAPKGTPQEAIDGMAAALEKATETDRIQTFWKERVFEPKVVKGEALQTELQETWERIEPIAKMTASK